MTNPTKIFPSGIAKGLAFVNRTEEIATLANRITMNQHTVLMAPRRYGKTSLVVKVAETAEIPYTLIDLLAAFSAEYVRDQLVDKVSRLVADLLPSLQKAQNKIFNIFRAMQPEFTVGALGQKLKLTVSANATKDITELLLRLDETAAQFKQKAIIFIDEFQQISKLKNHHSIEASIRHAVERSEHITYIFSGSNRQMLTQIFGDQGRPLYRLCHLMYLERMSLAIYEKHLQNQAQKRWHKKISEEALQKISELTELHPFYMNVLCQTLWLENHPPESKSIITRWEEYVRMQRHVISHEIMELSANQRRVFTQLAIAPIQEPLAASFLASLKLSASSVQQAVEMLERKDLIYRDKNNAIQVLDPAMRFYLNKILWS